MADERDVALAQLADQLQQLLDPLPAESVHGRNDHLPHCHIDAMNLRRRLVSRAGNSLKKS